MFYMANKLGAWQVGGDHNKGKVEFKLFFPKFADGGHDPKIAEIRVAGDFQSRIPGQTNWDFPGGLQLAKNETADGTLWSHRTAEELPSDYYEYKYRVTFADGDTRIVSDPCARYGGTNNQNAAFVIGGSLPAENVVTPLKGGRKHLRDLIVYEMNLDDFTDEYRIERYENRAPLAAAVDKLDYLKALGFNAILFMPWTAWENPRFSWGYAPYQYFAVEYRYANDLGRPAEKLSWLKKLVSECHDRGIHVIMDGVFNHVSVNFPYKWLYRNTDDCPYIGGFGEFPGLQDLDFHNECTNDFIRDVCLYWIDEFGIDGIRFDNTVNFYLPGDLNGLPTLMERIQNHIASKREKNFSLTLEHLREDAANITNDTKATSYWDNALYGKTFDGLWWNRIDLGLLNAVNNQRFLVNSDKVPTTYLANHDHSHVTWQAGARDNLGAMRWFKTQPYAILPDTSPATPMVQNGQEFGEDDWIMEDDEGTGRRVIPRPLRWQLADDRIGMALRKLYQRLGEIRQAYAGLRSPNFYPQPWEPWQTQFDPQGYGIDVERQLAIYHRWGHNEHGTLQRFIIVLNFSDQAHDVGVPFPENGEWVELLSDYAGTWKPVVSNWRLSLTAASNWGYVFYK